MIEVNVNGKTYEVRCNPWLKQHFNLTNQMLLINHMPEMAQKLKAQAEAANKQYDEEQKRLKAERKKIVTVERAAKGPRTFTR